jgi:hypothetical protein
MNVGAVSQVLNASPQYQIAATGAGS